MVQYESDYDPSSIIDNIVSTNFDTACLDEFDDTEVDWARNWLEWCLDKRFLGLRPFPRQIQIALSFLGEYCPHCTDKEFFSKLYDQEIGEILDRVVPLQRGVCPKCGVTQIQCYADGSLSPFVELAGVAGMRSGKTSLFGMIATYHLHRFLSISAPAKFFGLIANGTLHMTMSALTAGQAEETLWQSFTDIKSGSAWFKSYHDLLKSYGARKGVCLLQDKTSFLFYEHKRIFADYCGSDQKKLRGRTRILTAVDELGWFDASGDSILMNADEVHNALEKSLRTIRSAAENLRLQGLNWIPTGIDINISSPSCVDDKIMQLYKNSQGSTRTFGFHQATWEMNPTISYASLEEERRIDENRFWREYGAVPPLAANPFISRTECISRSISPYDPTDLAIVKPEKFTDALGVTFIYGSVHPLIQDKNTPRILTIDIGHSKNSFALTMAHYNSTTTRVELDLVVIISPTQDHHIHSARCYEHVIVPLIKSFNIKEVVYDRWNSLDQISRIRDEHGVDAFQYSLRFQDFTTIRSNIEGGRVLLPKPEVSIEELEKLSSRAVRGPISALILQLLTVREISGKLLKPLNGDDDAFRAFALAIHRVLSPEHNKNYIGGGSNTAIKPQAGIGVIYLGRGGKNAPMHSSTGFIPNLGTIYKSRKR